MGLPSYYLRPWEFQPLLGRPLGESRVPCTVRGEDARFCTVTNAGYQPLPSDVFYDAAIVVDEVEPDAIVGEIIRFLGAILPKDPKNDRTFLQKSARALQDRLTRRGA